MDRLDQDHTPIVHLALESLEYPGEVFIWEGANPGAEGEWVEGEDVWGHLNLVKKIWGRG